MTILGPLLEGWRASRGAGTTVALVDSGVEKSHPELRGARIDCTAISMKGDGVAVAEDSGIDFAGHGTACAARILTLAPEARILSCRVLSGTLRSTARLLLESLEWLLQRDDIDVVNLSLGTPNRAFGLEIAHAVDRFYARGIPVVASAGPSERPDYPAIFGGPVSVTTAHCATDDELEFRPNELVEFAARGTDLLLPWAGGRRATVSGSSFAAPLVAGRMARFKSLRRDLRVWELKTLLQHQADPARSVNARIGE